jgi:damage-control phosphatase, subfamily III
MTEEQIKSLQSTGGEALAQTEKNILGNNVEELWELVKKLKGKPTVVNKEDNEVFVGGEKRKGGRIDFVLDNAGFELYCDCVYGKTLPRFL